MTWRGVASPGEHIVRITHIDREGVPYPARVTGRGADAYSVLPGRGTEVFDDFDPDFPALRFSSELQVHLRTHADADAPASGLCCFALEVFTPGPSDNWLYVLFPKINGRLISFRDNAGRYVISAFGKTCVNPNLGTPVEGFTPDRQMTMMAGTTFYNPLVPA